MEGNINTHTYASTYYLKEFVRKPFVGIISGFSVDDKVNLGFSSSPSNDAYGNEIKDV